MITAKCENNLLTLAPAGRIDTSNAAAVEEEINGLRARYPDALPLIDAEKLEYISSAGLRVILRLLKTVPALKVVNVSPDLYEIFEVTGFTEMMTVEKAYRKLDVAGCEIIGRGANGEVYRLDPETIVKVYLNPDALPEIHRERELARRAFVLGIPTAIPYDVVRVGTGYGSVFELLNAKSLAKILAADPEKLEETVRFSVDLLKKIHGTEVQPDDMPDMRAVALDWAAFLKDYLPEETFRKLYALIEAVPVSHRMLHGDYHVKNVMVQDGEALLIDMDTLSQGDPVFEFASMFNAYLGFSALNHENVKGFLGLDYETANAFWKRSLALYFGTDDQDCLQQVADKAALVGYTRLMRRAIRRKALETEEGRAQVEFYKNEIVRLAAEIDTLGL